MPQLPHYPTSDPSEDDRPVAAVPATVTIASALLIVNLALSIAVTVLSLTHVDALFRLALQNHGSSSSSITRQTVKDGLYIRGVINVGIGVFYFFLVSRLRQRRWWAWRRTVWISFAGSLGVIYLLTQPYTPIFKVEQVLQLVVLLSIGVCTLHPNTRAFVGPRGNRSRWRS